MPGIAKLGVIALVMSWSPTEVRIEAGQMTTQRIERLWMVTYMNDDGIETIAQTKSPTGEYVPLMAVDQGRLESIIALGKNISKAYQKKLTVVELSNCADVGEINP